MSTGDRQEKAAADCRSIFTHWYVMPASVFLLGILAILLLTWTNAVNARHRENFAFACLLMDLQAKTAMAHLWLEEAVVENSAEKMEMAESNLAESRSYVHALLNGGKIEYGLVLQPLHDTALLGQAEKISEQLAEVEILTQRRFSQSNGTGPGSEMDEHFNRIYIELQEAASVMEDIAEKNVVADYAESKRLFSGINFGWAFIFLAMTGAVGRIASRKKYAEDMLLCTQEELEKRVAQQTQELRSANEHLQLELIERQRVEESLCKSEQEAARQAHLAAMGEMAAGVAHEINNPVNGIINCAEILMNKSDAASKEHELGRRIVKEGNRIAYITKSLLSFAREDSDEKSPLHIRTSLADVLALTEPQLKRDGILLALEVPDDTPLVQAQPQQIEQVFLNIINNARDALNLKYPEKSEGKSLLISARKMMAEGRPIVRVSFLDQGTGIPAGLMSRIKTPFFSTKPRGKGTGLGLSISHGIVARHGGRLTIDSVEGEYTEVGVELPVNGKG